MQSPRNDVTALTLRRAPVMFEDKCIEGRGGNHSGGTDPAPWRCQGQAAPAGVHSVIPVSEPITGGPVAAAVLAAALLAAAMSAAAGTTVALEGTYRCASYNVSGGGGSCRHMPRLTLHADGSYQYSSTRGRWRVEDGKLLLSESKLWGAGTILGRDTIRFEYDYRGWRHVVTWTCQPCGSTASGGAAVRATPGNAAASPSVGVSLTLRFDQAIGGVSTFTIVPAESVQGYGHNTPLPENAVQGLARETGATTVALGTNVNNKLPSGRRYVVFLSWPRETIPVAILDLPATNQDYVGTLAATLDGASVLARLSERSPVHENPR